MKPRVVCVTALVAASLLVGAKPVFADWYDVLEALSGPGPFTHDRAAHVLVTVCPYTRSLLGRSSSVKGIFPCVYHDQMHYRAPQRPDDPRFGDVEAELTEHGVSFELQRFFEYGFGFGTITFETYGVKSKHNTFTPLRVIVKPLMGIPWFASKEHDRAWGAALKLYVRETRIAGPITGKDFGVAESVFNEPFDYATSAGVMIDLSEPAGWLIRNWPW